jgi:hypothetical protein
MRRRLPRRLLLTMAVAALLLVTSLPALADEPINPDIPLDGIGPLGLVFDLLSGLAPPPAPAA